MTTSPARIDVNTFIGGYPFRHVPHPDAATLARVAERERVAAAWVGHLPSAFHRDPDPANEELFAELSLHPTLLAAPTVRPDWPRWEQRVVAHAGRGAVAIRCYPQLVGLVPGDPQLRDLGVACAALRLPLMLTVRFEDLRQRHALDTAGDLQAAAVRELARAHTGARIIVTAASREFIEEVHWGLTAREQDAVFYDISWVWGPPTEELASLCRHVGAARLLYGSMWPLRLAQTPRANLALLAPELMGRGFADPRRLYG